ncbi:MAG: nucleotidyltransferase [Candidatus Micrarchaeota archaeon]
MEFTFSKRKIVFNRPLSELDRLVLKFVKVLEKQKVEYVIISGYVAILFGRSRNTEDVDLFIEELDFAKFESLWNALNESGFECINAENAKEAFEDYLNEKLAILFAEKGSFEPNFELKFPKSKYNRYSLENKIEVVLNKEPLMVSELELQIAFKLSLGSDKDFEDCRHLFNVFKDYLNMDLLKSHISELRVEKQAERILWKKPY